MKHRALCPGHNPGIFFTLLISLFLAFLLPVAASSEEQMTIDSTGTASISPGGPASARDAAIADALRKAVEQAAGTLVASDTLVENFQVLEDSVYTKSQGFVKSYSIISEGQQAGLYEVSVKAVVATGALAGGLDALGLLQKKAERPRVLFMVAEKGFALSEYDYWWNNEGRMRRISATDAALKQAFISKGFNVVDGRAIDGLLGPIGVDVTEQDAARMGRALDAEVVVFGKVFIEEGPSSGATSIVTYMADMTAEAARVDDGVVLASQKGRGISRHISAVTGSGEAVSRAAAIVAEGLTTQIAEKWAGPQTIRITLKGMDYGKAVEFKRFLKTRVRGIEAIYQRRHAEGETALEVEVKTGAQAVADEIARHGKYRVIGFSAHALEVEGAE